MNIIQKIRSLFFGKEEIIETPAPVEVKLTVKEMVEAQEAPLPKPRTKRKYNRKKKSTGESK